MKCISSWFCTNNIIIIQISYLRLCRCFVNSGSFTFKCSVVSYLKNKYNRKCAFSNRKRRFRWKWRTWLSGSEPFSWQRQRWRNIRTTLRCSLTFSTVSRSLTRARPNCARPGSRAWREYTSTTETSRRFVSFCDKQSVVFCVNFL